MNGPSRANPFGAKMTIKMHVTRALGQIIIPLSYSGIPDGSSYFEMISRSIRVQNEDQITECTVLHLTDVNVSLILPAKFKYSNLPRLIQDKSVFVLTCHPSVAKTNVHYVMERPKYWISQALDGPGETVQMWLNHCDEASDWGRSFTASAKRDHNIFTRHLLKAVRFP